MMFPEVTLQVVQLLPLQNPVQMTFMAVFSSLREMKMMWVSSLIKNLQNSQRKQKALHSVAQS